VETLGNGFQIVAKVDQAPDEILKVAELAHLLKVADKTVYTMAQRGELPAFKVRGQWRFRRADIGTWIEAQTNWSRARCSRNGG
jgi:excisionase family DNA binding protein